VRAWLSPDEKLKAPVRGDTNMPHTYTNLNFHIIFGTKDHRPLIDEKFKEPLLTYIIGIVTNISGKILAINAMPDHVHILLSSSADKSSADLARAIKTNSSKYIHEQFPDLLFQWQEGYGAFTVSHSQIDAVVKYIAGQAEHHKRISFEEEFTEFLKRHGVEFDPKYMWR
jgi:putative transposase